MPIPFEPPLASMATFGAFIDTQHFSDSRRPAISFGIGMMRGNLRNDMPRGCSIQLHRVVQRQLSATCYRAGVVLSQAGDCRPPPLRRDPEGSSRR